MCSCRLFTSPVVLLRLRPVRGATVVYMTVVCAPLGWCLIPVPCCSPLLWPYYGFVLFVAPMWITRPWYVTPHWVVSQPGPLQPPGVGGLWNPSLGNVLYLPRVAYLHLLVRLAITACVCCYCGCFRTVSPPSVAVGLEGVCCFISSLRLCLRLWGWSSFPTCSMFGFELFAPLACLCTRPAGVNVFWWLWRHVYVLPSS